jgi:hypothetical protein
MSQDPKTPKKEINLNMPLDEFKKLTPEERRDYKIKSDEIDRKTKEGYDKAKKQPLKDGGAVHTMPDGKKMEGAKHGMKHGGYVLSAEDKERKKIFESSPPAKRGIPIKKSATKEMKHGGAVKSKKCRMDGIAVRGKTRAKQRSK